MRSRYHNGFEQQEVLWFVIIPDKKRSRSLCCVKLEHFFQRYENAPLRSLAQASTVLVTSRGIQFSAMVTVTTNLNTSSYTKMLVIRRAQNCQKKCLYINYQCNKQVFFVVRCVIAINYLHITLLILIVGTDPMGNSN